MLCCPLFVEAEWRVTMMFTIVDNLEQCGRAARAQHCSILLQQVDDSLPCRRSCNIILYFRRRRRITTKGS